MAGDKFASHHTNSCKSCQVTNFIVLFPAVSTQWCQKLKTAVKVEDPLGENIDANRHKSAPHEIQYSALSVCVCVFFWEGGI